MLVSCEPSLFMGVGTQMKHTLGLKSTRSEISVPRLGSTLKVFTFSFIPNSKALPTKPYPIIATLIKIFT